MDNTPKGSKYQIGQIVAQGGMGAILRAQDLHLDRPVAMKVMLRPGQSSEDSQQRFLREAKVLARLEHPNIVPVHELGRDAQGQVFYTMKFVHGDSLHAVLKGIKAGDAETIAKYPLNHLLTIFQKICDAIAFAHSKGIIHRDLKPANIMIGEYGEVLVMDWGLAKDIREPEDAEEKAESGKQKAEIGDGAGVAEGLTLPGAVMGTPNFMAPEQAAGRVEDQDQRTDIFALGGILYNILTLHTPVKGDTVGELLGKIQKGYIPPPVYYNHPREMEVNGEAQVEQPNLPHCPGGQVPGSLSAVAMKALAVHRGERYQTVAELQREIEAFGGGFATSAEQAGTWKQLRLLIKRNRRDFILAGSGIFLLLATASGLVFRINEERKSAQHNLARLEATAPTFYRLAQSLVAERKLSEALLQIDSALNLKPEETAYHNLRGQICQTMFRFKEARDAFTEALKRDPRFPHAADNLKLCEQMLARTPGGQVPSMGDLENLRAALLSQGRTPESSVVGTNVTALEQKDFDYWKAAFAKTGLKGELSLDENKELQLVLTDISVKELSALKGLPLVKLDLGCPALTDISALRGMRLKAISLPSKVVDLSALVGMPLTTISSCCGSELKDISPLKGMPLTGLGFLATKVFDLSPLAGMPLTQVNFEGSALITDISPLQGSKLTALDIAGTKVANLAPLQGMPLTMIRMDETPVQDITVLATLSQLQSLRMATRVSDLSPLQNLPLTYLEASGAPVKDLSPLQGMRLDYLELDGIKASDLAPLQGMPLTTLRLGNTPVKDLAPLAGMKLNALVLTGTLVSDLSPLKGMPLQFLLLDKCNNLRDVSPLVECRQLEFLSIPRNATNIGALRDLPKLKRLGYTASHPYGWEQVTTPADFWKAYDARKKK
jgi:serine/threonine protein kinase/Leucine-rich repeat (LRR) protein